MYISCNHVLTGSKLDFTPLTRIWARYLEPSERSAAAYLGFNPKFLLSPISKNSRIEFDSLSGVLISNYWRFTEPSESFIFYYLSFILNDYFELGWDIYSSRFYSLSKISFNTSLIIAESPATIRLLTSESRFTPNFLRES